MALPHKKRTQLIVVAATLVLFGAAVAFQVHLDSFGCKRAGSLRNTTSTPPELQQGAMGCVQLKRYEDAAYMLTLSDAFMRFDQKRRPPRPAHHVPTALPLTLDQQLSASERQALTDGFAKLGAANRKESVCRALARTRAPTYAPIYMRNFERVGITDNRPAPVTGFDPHAAWAATVAETSYCQT